MSGFQIAVRGATGFPPAACRLRAGQKDTAALDMNGVCAFLTAFFHGRSVAKQTGYLTGISASTAEKWLRRETRVSGEHLAMLIAVFGPPFVAAAMPQAHWAKEAAHDAAILDLTEKLTEAIRRKLAA